MTLETLEEMKKKVDLATYYNGQVKYLTDKQTQMASLGASEDKKDMYCIRIDSSEGLLAIVHLPRNTHFLDKILNLMKDAQECYERQFDAL